LLDVYVNGSKLTAAEFTATNGTTFVLTEASVVGNQVQAIRYNASVTGISGSGTTNYVPKFTASQTVGNSLIFDNGSAIGIGIAAPTSLLHVSASGYPAITIQGGATAGGGLKFLAGTDTYAELFGEYQSANNGMLLFRTRGSGTVTERMRITSDGSIGINGAPNPDSGDTRLQINGGQYGTLNLRSTSVNASVRAHNPNGGLYVGTTSNHFAAIFTNDTERMRITAAGSLLLGSTAAPTVTGGTAFVIGDTIFCSGTFNVGSPYSQTLRVDIVWNNWGGNNIAAIVEVDMIAREWANLGGVAFGRVYALSSGGSATFNNALNTSNMTTANGTFALSSPASYTLRLTFTPTNSKDLMGYFIKIPNSSGGTGTNISSITASLV
jgi:hypothetical protein